MTFATKPCNCSRPTVKLTVGRANLRLIRPMVRAMDVLMVEAMNVLTFKAMAVLTLKAMAVLMVGAMAVVMCGAGLAQLTSAPGPTASAPLQANAKLDQITDRLQRIVPDLIKEADVPGLSIALIKEGGVVWHHGFGVKDSRTKEPVADNTV